ncbi:DUF3048 domain-containing protein [Bacillus smithii]|nr:DUF3048 domain-containing protein [Bacillus smithii]
MFMLKKWLAAACIMILTLSGCAGSGKENSRNDRDQIQEKVSDTDKHEVRYRYPLTGIGTTQKPSDRAVAVVINNHPKARPQSGLQSADIVYEVLAEGDITRFLAIFQSQKPDKIGPVRSARDYMIDLAKGYDSLFIAHGYSPEAKQMLQSGLIDNLNGIQYDGTLFKRSKDRKAPHNSYITFENIQKGAAEKQFKMTPAPRPLPFYMDNESKHLSGRKVENVHIAYSKYSLFNADYRFDAKTKKMERYSGGEPTIDAETKKPVLVDNLLIIETVHRVIDSKGRREIDLTSGGKAYWIQRGVCREVEWRNENGRILPYENGHSLPFVPGKTWINIVKSLDSVSFS